MNQITNTFSFVPINLRVERQNVEYCHSHGNQHHHDIQDGPPDIKVKNSFVFDVHISGFTKKSIDIDDIFYELFFQYFCYIQWNFTIIFGRIPQIWTSHEYGNQKITKIAAAFLKFVIPCMQFSRIPHISLDFGLRNSVCWIKVKNWPECINGSLGEEASELAQLQG